MNDVRRLRLWESPQMFPITEARLSPGQAAGGLMAGKMLVHSVPRETLPHVYAAMPAIKAVMVAGLKSQLSGMGFRQNEPDRDQKNAQFGNPYVEDPRIDYIAEIYMRKKSGDLVFDVIIGAKLRMLNGIPGNMDAIFDLDLRVGREWSEHHEFMIDKTWPTVLSRIVKLYREYWSSVTEARLSPEAVARHLLDGGSLENFPGFGLDMLAQIQDAIRANLKRLMAEDSSRIGYRAGVVHETGEVAVMPRSEDEGYRFLFEMQFDAVHRRTRTRTDVLVSVALTQEHALIFDAAVDNNDADLSDAVSGMGWSECLRRMESWKMESWR
jgi:hypothetical protein